jgi:prephenate dehydrogenase
VKVAIIGGSGKMGRWFARFLLQDGQEVVICGRNEKKLRAAGRELEVKVASMVDAIQVADAVLLSVSVESFEEVVAQISPHISPGQVVVDITSLKVFPVATMHKYLKGARMLGTHPLFGPGAANVANQNFVLTPTSDGERTLAQKVREYLEARGARISLMTPAEHDEKMAVVLGLAHFIAIISADTLINTDRLKQTEAVGGITYKVLLTLVESVVSENPELYASLQMTLPDMVGIEAVFHRKVTEWADLVKNKNRPEFIRRMNVLKDKLREDSPDFGQAYQNMYRLAAER